VKCEVGVLRGVDVAEVIVASRGFLEIHGEERRREGAHGVFEEGLLLDGLDGVESIKGETHEPRGRFVVAEGRGDCLC